MKPFEQLRSKDDQAGGGDNQQQQEGNLSLENKEASFENENIGIGFKKLLEQHGCYLYYTKTEDALNMGPRDYWRFDAALDEKGIVVFLNEDWITKGNYQEVAGVSGTIWGEAEKLQLIHKEIIKEIIKKETLSVKKMTNIILRGFINKGVYEGKEMGSFRFQIQV